MIKPPIALWSIYKKNTALEETLETYLSVSLSVREREICFA